jgi:small subunit ribosomal protein S17
MNTRRRMIGVVTSDKMEKTVVVEVSRTFSHRLYKKVVHSHQRFMAHNELGARLGDQVQIVESRPLSRNKRWVVEKVLRHDIAAADPIINVETEA